MISAAVRREHHVFSRISKQKRPSFLYWCFRTHFDDLFLGKISGGAEGYERGYLHSYSKKSRIVPVIQSSSPLTSKENSFLGNASSILSFSRTRRCFLSSHHLIISTCILLFWLLEAVSGALIRLLRQYQT
jgi:hypothetical protein